MSHLFKGLLRSLNGLRRGLLSSVWGSEARWRGVELGAAIVCNGRPYLHREAGSRIRIGDHVVLNSSLRSNPINCARPVSLRTMKAGAEIILGCRVGLSGVSICAAQRVEIGEGTFVGADAVIFDNDFHAPVGEWGWGAPAADNPKPVLIGRGCSSARAIILKGVTIGDRAIIGPGGGHEGRARGCDCGGNPARLISPQRERPNLNPQRGTAETTSRRPGNPARSLRIRPKHGPEDGAGGGNWSKRKVRCPWRRRKPPSRGADGRGPDPISQRCMPPTPSFIVDGEH